MSTLLICFASLFAGCPQIIEEIKTEDNIGKTISVKREVTGAMKILTLSGYSIQDENGDTIAVFSEDLPTEGETVTAKGTLIKKPLFGYYIDSNK